MTFTAMFWLLQHLVFFAVVRELVDQAEKGQECQKLNYLSKKAILTAKDNRVCKWLLLSLFEESVRVSIR